jgi:hypothetical protein
MSVQGPTVGGYLVGIYRMPWISRERYALCSGERQKVYTEHVGKRNRRQDDGLTSALIATRPV